MNRTLGMMLLFGLALWMSSQPATAQSQQDINALQTLLPWAEALDKRLEEKRQQDAQKIQNEIAQMEQSIKDREAREAAKKIEMQQRAAAIKQWNPKDNPPPSLRAGEHIVLTRNGCRLVIPVEPSTILEMPSWNAQGQPSPPKRISHKDYFASMLWSGDCELGVANGFGALAEPAQISQMLEYETAYFLGRNMNFSKMPSTLNGEDQFELGIIHRGKKHITRLLRDDPFKPLWGDFVNGEPSTSLSYDGITVATAKNNCLGVQGITKKKFSGCNYKNDYTVYGVSVRTPGANVFDNTTYCPNPKTPQGCEALWYQLAGPQIEKMKAAWQEAENTVNQEAVAIEKFSTGWLAQRQKYKDDQQRSSELAAEAVFKSTPNKLSDQQITSLRQKYNREKNDNGLNALDELVWKREAAAKAAAEKKATAAQTARSNANVQANNSGISCAEAVSQLQQTMNTAGNERQFLDSHSGDQIQEQILWITHFYNKAVNRLPQCANDPTYRKRFSDEVIAVQNNCPGRVQGPANCSSGVNYFLNESALESALQQLSASVGKSTASGKSSLHTGNTCSTYEQCVQVENASGIAGKLDAIPGDNINMKSRGIIAASDMLVRIYKQCLPDNRCQSQIGTYQKLRADTLQTCQKISTDPSSCTVSPF